MLRQSIQTVLTQNRHSLILCCTLGGGSSAQKISSHLSPCLPPQASPSSKRRNQTLQPIIEGETAHFCDEIKEEEEEEDGAGDQEIQGMQSEESEVIIALDPAALSSSQQPQLESILRPKLEESSGKLTLDLRLSSSNASSM